MSAEKKFELKIEELQERMKAVIDLHLSGLPLRGRWIKMEQETGISARRWMNLHSSINKPSLEMLLQLVELEPEFAAFLLCGNYFRDQEDFLHLNARRDVDQEELEDVWIGDIPDFKK